MVVAASNETVAAPTTVDNSDDAAPVTATVSLVPDATPATAEAGFGDLGAPPAEPTMADVPSAFPAKADADQHFAEITATAFPAAKGAYS